MKNDYRKLKMISWKHGLDIHDCRNREYRKIAGRIGRRFEKRRVQKDIEREMNDKGAA